MRTHRRRLLYGRRLRDESGQATVEFAFVMLMMLVLLLGLIDFARLFLQYQVVTDAAREGARKAVVQNPAWDTGTIFSDIVDFLAISGIDTSGASGPIETCAPPGSSVSVVTIYSCDWNGGTGTVASVGVSVPFEFAIVGPFLGWATGDRTITLRTWFSMRNE